MCIYFTIMYYEQWLATIFLSPFPKQNAYMNRDMIAERSCDEKQQISPLYWSISTIITINDKRQYIAWMEMSMYQVEWIYETPFGAHVNGENWCPIFLSSWIEEKADDP